MYYIKFIVTQIVIKLYFCQNYLVNLFDFRLTKLKLVNKEAEGAS